MINFISHPYHRGGVTSWIIDSLNYLYNTHQPGRLITVQPKKEFISGQGRPLIRTLINYDQSHIKEVDNTYELGTIEYRAVVLAKSIQKNVPKNEVLIPSDDQASWMACAMVSKDYQVIGVLHSDDKAYYTLYSKYHDYCDGVVTVSNRILRNLRPSKTNTCVIPCGIQVHPYQPQHRTNKLVFVGRLDEEQKRVSDIIPIILALKRKTRDFVLEIWGHGGATPSLKHAIQENGLEKHVKIMGWGSKEDIYSSLKQAKVLLQTSNYEGMSVAVMEALANGCTVVSSRVSGVEDYENIEGARDILHLFPIGDVKRGAELCKIALHNHSVELTNQAHRFFTTHFHIGACMNNHIQFANSLKPRFKEQYPVPSYFSKLFSKALALSRLIKYKLT